MAKQTVNVGTTANDGTGDQLRDAFTKLNDNHNEIYLAGPVGTNLKISANSLVSTDAGGNIVLDTDTTGTVELLADTNVTGSVDISANAAVGGTLDVTGITTVTELNATLTLDVSGNATLGGTLDVTGNTEIVGTLDAGASEVSSLRTNVLALPATTPPGDAIGSANTGTTGEIAWDANYIYVCVTANQWVRAALGSW